MKRQIELFTKLNSLPKFDLRVLLTGSIRKTTLLELLDFEEKEKLEKLFSFVDYEVPSLFSDISKNALKDLKIVRRITKEILEDWQKHNIIYLELRTFILSQKDSYNKNEYLKAVLEEINDFNGLQNQRMIARLIISLDRKSELNEYEEIYQVYKNIKEPELKKLIVGIDYSGHENSQINKYEDIIPILKKFKEEGLGITIHIGENPNYQMFPFNLFIPDRISHGSFLKAEHINEVLQRNIPIEICPTSSYKITHSTDYSRIPMKNYWGKKAKLLENGEEFTYKNISINSDVRTLLLSDISQEYHEIGVSFNFGIKELKNIIYNSINFIFEKDEEIRNKLKSKLENYNC